MKDRVAVVTGGGRGIGAAIARALAGAGARVVISGRDEGALARTVEDIKGRGGWVAATRCDVTKGDEVAHLLEFTRREAGSAAIVINNAGVAKSARFADTDEKTWREVMSVNLDGVYYVTRAFLPDVTAAGKQGRIVMIASTAAKIGFSYTSAYCASKHAVLGLTRALAHELGAKGTTVNCVCPGWVDTDMAQDAIDNIVRTTKRTAEQARAELERMSPQRRLMTADEVAAVTLFLCGDDAAGVNGQAWNVDGGQVMF